jgi:hypothetical protein
MDGSTDSRNSRTKSELNDPAGEAARGGADAVNDTPGLARHGTAPGSQFEVVSDQPRSPTGNRLIWLAVIVALGLILGYAAGMLQ